MTASQVADNARIVLLEDKTLLMHRNNIGTEFINSVQILDNLNPNQYAVDLNAYAGSTFRNDLECLETFTGHTIVCKTTLTTQNETITGSLTANNITMDGNFVMEDDTVSKIHNIDGRDITFQCPMYANNINCSGTLIVNEVPISPERKYS